MASWSFCRKSFAFVILSGITPFQAGAQDLQEVLAIAKIAGACGILDSAITFQASTKMSGGDEFVSRFYQVEAARLGRSVEELLKLCNDSIRIYDMLWAASEEEGDMP
ncbi:MAG: hypothetical protein M0Q95_17165 [Porticoccaceae bacterium]|nr:hypothetical protein [Porticoccaceae bacterium]